MESRLLPDTLNCGDGASTDCSRYGATALDDPRTACTFKVSLRRVGRGQGGEGRRMRCGGGGGKSGEEGVLVRVGWGGGKELGSMS